jgi:hypothetical protein
VFAEAKTILSTIVTPERNKVRVLDDEHSIDDVATLVLQAKDGYDRRRTKGKAWQWLSAFSNRLQHYAPVMDALAKSNPEYVSLAWGTVKFLFVVGNRNSDRLLLVSQFLTFPGFLEPRRRHFHPLQGSVPDRRLSTAPRPHR